MTRFLILRQDLERTEAVQVLVLADTAVDAVQATGELSERNRTGAQADAVLQARMQQVKELIREYWQGRYHAPTGAVRTTRSG